MKRRFTNHSKWLPFLLLLAFWAPGFGQGTLKVSGTVTDKSGAALPGVTVKIKNTSQAGATNVTGKYTIIIPNGDAVLVFSMIGMTAQEVKVGSLTTIDITLSEENSNLNEVVVIGYGTVKKRDITGSLSSLDMQDFQKAPVLTIDQALAGRMAGVQVSSGDGQPGVAATVTIRGASSLTQDNSPLYVIDGFPIESPNNNTVDPSDVESIEVLKDASATAIYGARGANGVVLITTKRGKTGAPQITYNGAAGIQEPPKHIALMDPYNFVKLQSELAPSTAASLYFTGGKTVDSYAGVQGDDWQNLVYRKGVQQNHYVSISGGTDATKYSVSFSGGTQNGVLLNTGLTRYQGRFSLDQTVNKNLKTGANAAYGYVLTYGDIASQTNSTFTSNILYSVWGYRPVSGSTTDLTAQNFDASINTASDSRYNPVSTLNNEVRRGITNNLLANLYLQYTIAKDLNLRVSGGITNNVLRNENFFNSNTRLGDPTLSSTGPNGSVIFYPVNSWLNENTLNYKKTFGSSHTLDLLGGFTMQGVSAQSYGVSAIQVPNESLGISGLDEGVPNTVTATKSNNTLVSFLGRANYSYKSRYLLTASFRADGSSKFVDANRWSYFPSGAFAWHMSEESFMSKIPVINDAKLRVSYGLTGNNRVTDFPYLSALTLTPAVDYSFNNQTPTQGIYPTTLGNRSLKWETTATADIGYDLSLLKDRIQLTVDVYRKTTSDLLLNAQIPASTGYQNAFKNIGKVQNDGLEITINTVNINSKNFRWTSNFNISFNRSKTLALNDGQEALVSSVAWDSNYNPNTLYIAKLGQPISQFYGFVWDGNYQYSDFDKSPSGVYSLKSTVPTNGNARAAIQPGDIKYKDLNGDGVINQLDATVIGRALPIHTGGFSNNFKYNNFDLNVFFQWSYGNDLFNANRLIFEGPVSSGINQYATYDDRWTPDNQNNTYYRTGGYGPRGFSYSTRLIEDGSYLRLKTLSLGYNLSKRLTQKLGIKNLRLSAAAQNIWTWTNYSGLDPEVSIKTSALTPGFDFSAYPRAKTIVIGINATL